MPYCLKRMDTNYGAAQNWYGSYYELAVEVAPAPADERLGKSIERLWSCDALVAGPWADKGNTEHVLIPPLPAAEEMVASYGMLRIPDLGAVRCVSWIIREVENGSDWIDLCIPTAALEPFGLAHPIVSETPCGVIEAIDRALLRVAMDIYRDVPFELALIGEEMSGLWSSATIAAADLAQGGFVLPERLAQRLGASLAGETLTGGLLWIPNRCEHGVGGGVLESNQPFDASAPKQRF
jgi:hypothetical protein